MRRVSTYIRHPSLRKPKAYLFYGIYDGNFCGKLSDFSFEARRLKKISTQTRLQFDFTWNCGRTTKGPLFQLRKIIIRKMYIEAERFDDRANYHVGNDVQVFVERKLNSIRFENKFNLENVQITFFPTVGQRLRRADRPMVVHLLAFLR